MWKLIADLFKKETEAATAQKTIRTSNGWWDEPNIPDGDRCVEAEAVSAEFAHRPNCGGKAK